MLFAAVALAAAVPAAQARANGGADLVTLINQYRARPEACNGRRVAPLAPLTRHPVLVQVRIGTGTILQSSLEAAGFQVRHAEAISISGFPDAAAVMILMKEKYCSTLLNPDFKAAGASRSGDSWQVVLAQPTPPLALAPWPQAGRALLAAVNAARAQQRTCGSTQYETAPPLAWQDALGKAAHAHSADMAQHRMLRHQGKDGSEVGARAARAGYNWVRVGENIAAGQRGVEEVMAGWLASPGHCANIMDARFTEMGAAYVVAGQFSPFWTQVFARPR